MDSSLYPLRVVTNIPALDITVLRVPVVLPFTTLPRKQVDLDFAIQFDADHDQRVLPAIRSLWYEGLIPWHVRLVGESRGVLTLALAIDESPEDGPVSCLQERFLPHGSLLAYEAAVNKAAQSWADKWPVKAIPLAGRNLELATLLKLRTRSWDEQRGPDLAMRVPAGGFGS